MDFHSVEAGSNPVRGTISEKNEMSRQEIYDKEMVSILLNSLSYQAKELALDVSNDKLWEGQLNSKLDKISEILEKIKSGVR